MKRVKVYDHIEGFEADASVEDNASKPYIAVKKCRMLRSGVQLYARDEVPAELLKLLPPEARQKDIFKVYRRPEAIVKHLNDFNYLPLVNGHPKDDVTPDNVRELEIGRVGGQARLVTLDDGNVYVENDLVMDDRKAYDEYKNGKHELSIGLEAMWTIADSGEYDFEVIDFTNVNHLALVPRGRAGSLAKITDTMAAVSRVIGGYSMNGFLKMFGIGKTTDGAAGFKLSGAVLDCAKKIADAKMKPEEAEAEVTKVMSSIARLSDSDDRKILVGMVQDALRGASDLTAADDEAKKKVADAIDGLYGKCLDADEAKTKAVVADVLKNCSDGDGSDDGKNGGKKDEGKKDEGKKGEEAPQKDTAEVIEAAIKKALDSGIEGMVEKAVAKALGTDAGKPQAKGQQTDSAPQFSDADLLANAWGL